jgi:hypothetical protein
MNINVSTTITVTSHITAANVISGSVNVQKINYIGQAQSVLGTLHNDGVDPDLLAGDGTYSGTFMLNEPQAGSIGVRVSVGTKGSLLRSVSSIVSVDILPNLTYARTLAGSLTRRQ